MRPNDPTGIRSGIVAAAVLVAVVAAGPTAQAQNLIQNGTFDHDIASWESPGSTVVITHRTEFGSDLDGGSGPGCLEVQHHFWNGGASGPGQTVAGITPGGSYLFEASYYVPSLDNVADSASITVYWSDGEGMSLTSDYLSAWPLEIDTWARLSSTFIAPAGAATGWVRVLVGNPNLEDETRPGVAYFDDVWFAEEAATSASQMLFVPAAAAAHGLQDTYWSTTGWFSSVVDFPVTVSGALLRQGQDNSAAVAALTELGTVQPRGFLELTDMVTALGGSEATGGIYIEATAEAAGLPSTLIWGTTRTFTPDPTSDGSYGQAIPCVQSGARNEVVIPGVFQGTARRTNIGALNTSDQQLTLGVEIHDASGSLIQSATWTLEPWEQRQVTLPTFGVASIDGGTVTFTRTSAAGSFRAYTSVVDQESGDSVYNAGR